MSRLTKHIKIAAFVFFMLLLALPAIQFKKGFIKMRTLGGNYQFEVRPSVNDTDFYSRTYQKKYEKYINDHIGFREFFLRSYNEVWYRLFGELHAGDVVMGKNKTLYELNYIKDYTGSNFIGTTRINTQLIKARFIQEQLDKQDVHLILCFAPGKASYFPENIPDKFMMQRSRPTNYSYYSQRCGEMGLRHIDFNAWFVSSKEKSDFPLYTRGGIHWSIYGMHLVVDSLCRFMGQVQGAPLPEMVIRDTRVSDTARDSDDDIEKGLNLLFGLYDDKYYYPVTTFRESPGCRKPRVMVIADSYWWNVFGSGIMKKVFNGCTFFYYNKEVHYDNGLPAADADTINLKNETGKYDFIIILYTEATLENFSNGFIDRLFMQFTDNKDPVIEKEKFDKAVAAQESYIRNTPEWLHLVKAKALKYNIPLDTAIRRDAIFMVQLKK